MVLWLLLQSPGPDVPTGIIATIGRLTDFLVGYLSALAAVGALAMAAIEFAKKVADLRTRFHARRVLGFVTATTDERSGKANSLGLASGSPGQDVLTSLIQLTTGVSEPVARARAESLVASGGKLPLWQSARRDPAYALFGLEVERMLGAMQEAGDIALTTPATYPHLYLFMTSGASDDDVRSWFRNGARVMSAAADPDTPAPARADAKTLGDQFTRVRQVMKRRLDAFQLYTRDSWASWNQLWANVVGALTMFGLLTWMRSTDAANTPGLATTLMLSLLGGVLSPIAKDLITLLKRVKDG